MECSLRSPLTIFGTMWEPVRPDCESAEVQVVAGAKLVVMVTKVKVHAKVRLDPVSREVRPASREDSLNLVLGLIDSTMALNSPNSTWVS